MQQETILFAYDLSYTGTASAENFGLLYNTLGYECLGTKKAFIRTVEYIQPNLLSENSYWTLCDLQGNVVRSGLLRYRGISYGLQLWEADFSAFQQSGEYTLHIVLIDADEKNIEQKDSASFTLKDDLYGQDVLLNLTLYNAQARIAPARVGGGYYDCNTTMGEAYSHGIFLNGLVQTWLYRKDQLDNQTLQGLQSSASRAFDYLLKLHDASTGEFIHSYPGRYNEDINLGYHNTIEALYGFSAYLHYFSGIDYRRANNVNYKKAVKTVEYLQENFLPEMAAVYGYPYREYLIPVYYHLYMYSGDPVWLNAGLELSEQMLDNFDVRSMYRSGARGIPMFEGVYLFYEQIQGTSQANIWKDKLIKIKERYYSDIDERNALSILPMSAGNVAADEWDNMWKLPTGEYENNWILTTGRACSAADACFLGMMTDDPTLERIAAGEIGYIFGLNPGFSGDLVSPGSTETLTAGALVDNLDAPHVRGWFYWGFEMANDDWASVMNGFRIIDNQYVFRDETTDDWCYGETFIKHDGAFAYAICLYEAYVHYKR